MKFDGSQSVPFADAGTLQAEVDRLRALTTPITAEDVRAAEQAWTCLTLREGDRWRDEHEDGYAAFIADQLNRRSAG